MDISPDSGGMGIAKRGSETRIAATDHLRRVLPMSTSRKAVHFIRLSKADADFVDLPRFADDLDVHRRATDLAILDGGVIALRRVGGRGDDLTTMGTLDLDFDEHVQH